MDLLHVGLLLFAGIGVLTVIVLGFQLLEGEPLTLAAVVLLVTATLLGLRLLNSLERPALDAVDTVPNRVRGY